MNKTSVLQRLNYTFSLGTLFSIPFKLHWSIIPFFAVIPWMAYRNHMSMTDSLLLLLLMILVLGSVLLHELGHAGAANLLGVKTHDILLSPIGGIARLEKMPEEPIEEFKIAIAGPLVNLLIFTVIAGPILLLAYVNIVEIDWTMNNLAQPVVFLSLLAISNFILFLFNLVPAFPMDGGRILRAFLASRMSRQKATKIASLIGKVLAAVLMILGVVYMRPIWTLIGIFVFLMADIENRQEQETHKLRQIFASAICTQDYKDVKLYTPMLELIQMHFSSDERNFIVRDQQNKITGIIYPAILDDAMRIKENIQPVASYVTNRYAIVNVQDDALQIYDALIKADMPLALVMDYGELCGVIEPDRLLDVMRKKEIA